MPRACVIRPSPRFTHGANAAPPTLGASRYATHPDRSDAMSTMQGWAVQEAGKPLVLSSFNLGPLGAEEGEVALVYCGICHSDLSMIDNEWGMSKFPFVPGHEVVGRVTALGPQAKGLKIGQRVGIGWTAETCMHCHQC